ncbi:transcriptional regulator [Aliidongia dinghuensis]|uniref:Transcriptional regulator n=1 Tax=Aliidongia dinghuensis TaxID=1867774 RepID=A0A8J2YSH7_9PROT|nr:YafY family protein [Aliidongia dinghuensis]GGF10247.1 transcriptional regulator [Aliidongia dinghuensis]
MRASRLLTILMLLQTRGRMSAPALADELEVSVRTLYRDIDQLSAAGVPVYAERGRAGGFQLLDGWRTRLTGLTAAEAQAMFLAGLPGPAAQLGLGDAMAAAQLKLLAALPADWQADARRVSSRFHLDPVGWYRSAAPTDHLPAVAEAVWGERRLRIRYESWRGTVERVLDPLGLVLKAGDWYLIGRVGSDLRTYRLSNILELTVQDEGFARPTDFTLAEYWTASTRRFEAELQRDTARVRLSPRGLVQLRRLGLTALETVSEPDGHAVVTLAIEAIDLAVQELLRLGAEAEVLAPPALRDRMIETVEQLAAVYGPASAQA